MKTILLIIIGIIVVVVYLPIHYYYPFLGIGTTTETFVFCEDGFIQRGNTCKPDPSLLEPNTVLIYDVIENSETRLSIAPHDIVMDLKDGDTVTFVNDGLTTVNILDDSKGFWRFDNVKPSSQRTLIINSTGFYKFLVQNSRLGESGEIIALSDDTNSLPVETRAKMAQTIVGSDFGKGVGLIGVGSGGAEPGITIGIDEKFQDKHDDAEKFYYEKYRKMIPFDVPITIDFSTPIVPTG